MNITIDCAAIESRQDLHRIFAEALSFPSCYGSNLDALHDVLTDMTGTLRLEDWDQAREALGRYGMMAEKAIAAAAMENEKLDVIF